ncbi:MAG: hypothetical protein CM15mP89_1460 [Gammaproteobacteria bacterium]|nr:MAG: hypothetical protein CM15mP89_1460 [Gammaproteobacteria bacterium]
MMQTGYLFGGWQLARALVAAICPPAASGWCSVIAR